MAACRMKSAQGFPHETLHTAVILVGSLLLVWWMACSGSRTGAGPGDDPATDPTEERDAVIWDVDLDTADLDGAELLRNTGEECSEDEQCLSGQCETFGEQTICTEECTDTCPDEDLACFDNFCVPETYCDDSAGEGYGRGPGCVGTVCDTCDDAATCVEDEDDTFYCQCNPGYEGDGTSCSDVDECVEESDQCLQSATCSNTDGGYTCTCPPGYTGDGLSTGSGCGDIDECDSEAPGYPYCDVNSVCANSTGDFTCTCNAGWQGDGEVRGTGCSDVDECAAAVDPCGNGDCTDIDGGYTCSCDSGYQSSGGQFPSCVDVNECAAAVDPCGNGDCTDIDGGYTCSCDSGYQSSGGQFPSCVDVNECAAAVDPCGNGDCVNDTGGYHCTCDGGYEQTGDPPTCTNIDECSAIINPCGNGDCIDADGGYTCDCDDGYLSNGAQFPTCMDVNECNAVTDPCGNGDCVNDTGGYHCTCEDGYEQTGDPPTCTNINECGAAVDPCGEGECTDADGGYTCSCDSGYQSSGGQFPSCVDVNECAAAIDPCGNGDCVNDTGGYHCTCDGGYEQTGDPPTCTNINECDPDPCGVGLCHENEPGFGYYCACPGPYYDDGVTCSLNELVGTLQSTDPGHWADGTFAASCQDYRYPDTTRTYEGTTGDGYYLIKPHTDRPEFTVFCDMTTDGGGWTAIEPDTATDGFGWILTNLGAVSACDPASDLIGGHAPGNILCRYDIDLGFSFNAIRPDIVVVSLTGTGDLSELTHHNGIWGSVNCASSANHGDFVIGTAGHSGAVSSLGKANGVTACTTDGSYANNVTLDLVSDRVNTTRDTILRIELGENGGEDEGWAWQSGRIFVRNEVAIVGALTSGDPGTWESGSIPRSCQEYRFPGGSGAFARPLDGYYRIKPRDDLDAMAVYCDMTTDDGGWTLIDLTTAGLLGITVTDVDGNNDGCSLNSGRPQCRYAGLNICRFEIPVGFSFNTLRTHELLFESTAGTGDVSDLTYAGKPWGDVICDSRGDIVFGTPAHPSSVLSKGESQGLSICPAANVLTYGPGVDLPEWHGDEARTTADTTVRLEMGETGGQMEGWRWIDGGILVRNEWELAGDLTTADPGHWQDGTYAESCQAYRVPRHPYLYQGSTGDGFYTIDPDGSGPILPFPVYCDMTTDGGGWTLIAHVKRVEGAPYPGREIAGSEPSVLGYSIEATGIHFTQMALTHNGLASGAFAVFTLAEPQVFQGWLDTLRYILVNGHYNILALSAAESGGWGDIPLVCFNSATTDCLNLGTRDVAYGAVATGTGNCQQLDAGEGTGSGCGAWGLAPNAGDTTWDFQGGKVYLR